MIVVVAVVVIVLILIDQALDVTELLDVARDGDGAFLVLEIEFILRSLEKTVEQRVIYVNHGNHEPLLLLSFVTYNYRYSAFLRPFFLLPAAVVEQIQMRKVDVEVEVVMALFSAVSSAAGISHGGAVAVCDLRSGDVTPHRQQKRKRTGDFEIPIGKRIRSN
ncbi:hypothetical protein LINPERHAP2_LOCUS29172 [Linum perenne]